MVYIVMAYIVMAHTLLSYIVMTYTVVAYTVMSDMFMAYIIMAYIRYGLCTGIGAVVVDHVEAHFYIATRRPNRHTTLLNTWAIIT